VSINYGGCLPRAIRIETFEIIIIEGDPPGEGSTPLGKEGCLLENDV